MEHSAFLALLVGVVLGGLMGLGISATINQKLHDKISHLESNEKFWDGIVRAGAQEIERLRDRAIKAEKDMSNHLTVLTNARKVVQLFRAKRMTILSEDLHRVLAERPEPKKAA